MEKAGVYIIVVHFAGISDTKNAINSLLKEVELINKIVIVNNSENKSNDLELHFSENKNIEFINAEKNHGYSAACNFGIMHILKSYSSDFIWILNNDIEVGSGTLKNLLACSSKNGKVGFWGSKIFNFDDKKILQGVGGEYNKYTCRTKHIGSGKIDKSQYDSDNFKVEYPLGVSLFMRTEFLRDVGLLDENYFLYFEELDLVFRSRECNWTFSICNSSHIYHKGGVSIGAKKGNRKEKSSLSDFHAIRSRVIFTRKYLQSHILFLYLFLVVLSIEMLFRGKRKRIQMIFDLLNNIEFPYDESRYV